MADNHHMKSPYTYDLKKKKLCPSCRRKELVITIERVSFRPVMQSCPCGLRELIFPSYEESGPVFKSEGTIYKRQQIAI